MKPNKLAGVLLFLTAEILALGIGAAAQEKKPQFYMVEEYVVKPSMVAQFETGLKDVVATIYKPFDWPWPMEAYATDDFHYYFLYPFANFAEIDTAFARFYEILGKVGSDKWDALNKKMGDASEYYKQGTITLSPDLSYTPEKPRLNSEETKFVYWGFCYVLPGREMEFEAQFKKIVALFKSKGIDTGFKTWIGGLGTELPFYFYSMTGKTPADFFLTDEKVTKLVEPEITTLWNETLKLMRKYEFKIGSVRPDLWFVPAAKAK
jgi:hypothetical protein